MSAVRDGASEWSPEQPRWFRGEPATETPLLPSLYRDLAGSQRENQLLQLFRIRAQGFAPEALPVTQRTDQWLFLAQHVGLPTRLLDWTESALIGLYFALPAENPVVWMLNPLHLNHYAIGAPAGVDPNVYREFPLTFHRPRPPEMLNVAAENIAGAWESDSSGTTLPVAVYPSYVHTRLRAQRGCFTVHGKRKESLCAMVPNSVLKRYEIDPCSRVELLRDLSTLGVTESVAFPDLDGLARDLKRHVLG